MDGAGRVSKTEYQRLAERWRRLAADATTPRARNHLLTLARQCEFLALGVEVARDTPEAPGLFGAPQ
jgi:hypothetical protein